MNNGKFIKKFKAEKGISLIELIVAVAIYSVLTISAVGIFKMVIDGQRNSISAQNVQENMRYALEKVSKEIRMAEISNHGCEALFTSATALYKVFNTADGNTKMYFKNQYGDCVAYYLDNGRLKIMIDDGASVVDDFITPAKIEVSNLKFYVVDDLIGALHSVQPYITMTMNVRAVGLAINEQKMKLQITVSSRYYE